MQCPYLGDEYDVKVTKRKRERGVGGTEGGKEKWREKEGQKEGRKKEMKKYFLHIN